MVFSTRDPPTIQRMPWPADVDDEDHGAAKPNLSYDTWLLNDLDFSWLVESDGNVALFTAKILFKSAFLQCMSSIYRVQD